MSAAVLEERGIFAANRAHGRVALSVAAEGGETRRTRVGEEGSLRVRFPHAPPDRLEAVLVNTAGGMAGGDSFEVALDVAAEASLVVTTAAAEKVYRSTGADARMAVRIDIAAGGRVGWLPQETILFDGARMSRSFDVDLADGATLVLAEAVVFGRSASGEVVNAGRLLDRWRVRRAGRLVFAEALRLDGAIASRLAERAVAAGAVALATVLCLPGTSEQVEAVRALQDRFGGEAAISAWNGLCVMRFCAQDGATLRHDMTAALGALGAPLPRLWLN